MAPSALLLLALPSALGLLPVQQRLTRRCAPLRAADGNPDDFWVEYRDGEECVVSDMGASCMERAALPDKSPGFVPFTPWEDSRKPYQPRAAAAAPEVPAPAPSPVPPTPSPVPPAPLQPTASSEPPKTPAEARARARMRAVAHEVPLPIRPAAPRDVAAPAARKRMALRAARMNMDTGFPKFTGNNGPRI